MDHRLHQHPRSPDQLPPPLIIEDQQTLVMCDQIDTVDLRRLTDPVGFLTREEMRRVDEALTLVLDL